MDRRNQCGSEYPRIITRESLDVVWISGEEGPRRENSLSKWERSTGVESVMERASVSLWTIMIAFQFASHVIERAWFPESLGRLGTASQSTSGCDVRKKETSVVLRC